MGSLRLIFVSTLAVLLASIGQAQTRTIIIDTDAGSDDLMAIAFLLANPTVRIEAITVVNGLAHVKAGASNILGLLELSGRKDIPVFAGRSTPMRGSAEFPAEWRRTSDDLPGVTLPEALRQTEPVPAADYLVARLKNRNRPVRLLALGPLTNLAEALQREPSIAGAIKDLVIMGGAVRVPGNLGDGNAFQTVNKTAEWNIFLDPLAARIVFRAGVSITLIPLDATNKVPIDLAFLSAFQSAARTPLGRFVGQVLEADHQNIEGGFFYAWDPLAAVALLHPSVVKAAHVHIDIRQDPPEEGRTAQTPGSPNARVAMDADAAAFRRIFLQSFAH